MWCLLIKSQMAISKLFCLLHFTASATCCNHTCRIERDLRSCEVTAVTNKAQKKILRLQWDSIPGPLRYQCDALPTELWSLAGSRSSARSVYTHYMGSNPVGASEFFLGFNCNCLSCFTTAKISFTSNHTCIIHMVSRSALIEKWLSCRVSFWIMLISTSAMQ